MHYQAMFNKTMQSTNNSGLTRLAIAPAKQAIEAHAAIPIAIGMCKAFEPTASKTLHKGSNIL